MKKPIMLWMFGIIAMIFYLYSILLILCFSFAGAHFAIYVPIALIVFILFVASIIGLFRLKRWGRNLFIAFTVIINYLLLYLSGTIGSEHKSIIEISIGHFKFNTWDIVILFFSLALLTYLFSPSTRKLFK